MTAKREISAKRQFFLLSVAFSTVLALYSAWIIRDQLQTIKVVTDLKKDTVPQMINQLRMARDLDSLRFEADKAIHADTKERSDQGLYYVSVHVHGLDLLNDPVTGALIAELTDLLSGFDYANRQAHVLAWDRLSERLKSAADQMAFEAIAMKNTSIDSVESDLSKSMYSSILLLLLGISLQLLTLWYVGRAFIAPLKKMGLHLKNLDTARPDHALNLKSRTREITSIQNAINRLGAVLVENRLMNTALHTNEIELKREMELAKEATRVKSVFISNVSHEIRTPLSTISGMVYLLEKSGLTPAQLRQLGLLKQCSAHLNDLMSQVLDLSKMEAHMLTLEHNNFNLAALLGECKALFSLEFADKQLDCVFDVPDTLAQQTLAGDALRIKEIVINLLSNAVKFTPQGSVSLHAEMLQTSADHKIQLKLSVADTGIGLTQAQIGQLFQNFSQADSSTSRRFGGTGLGLSISKKLAELMSGDIGVTSAPGQGSVFWCTLWLTVVEQARPAGSDQHMSPDSSGHDHDQMVAPATAQLPDSDQPGSPDMICGQLARLASADDPLATHHFETNRDRLAGILGDAYQPVGKALAAYDLPEAVALLSHAGWHPASADSALPADNRPILLLVDDTPANITYLSGLLQDLCQLRVATSGQRAIDMTASGLQPQLVLMDVAMPDMDGFAALTAMTSQAAMTSTGAPGLAVMLISASNTPERRESARQLGAIDLLDRIAPPDQLRDTVARELHRQATAG